MKRLSACSALILAACLTSAQFAAAQSSSVYLRADAGSYVGYSLPPLGLELTDADTTFRSSYVGDDSAYVYTSLPYEWYFEFAAPTYSSTDGKTMPRPLEVGVYENVMRYPFNAPHNAGMDVNGMTEGYDNVSGWFKVLAIEYDSNFSLLSLAVDFAEYGTTNKSGPELYGSLRFNSDIPLTVPEPASYALLVSGILAMLAMRSRQKRFRSRWA